MYSKINVLEPVSKAYVFGSTRRLKQHSTTYSVMQKSMVACAKEKVLQQNRGEKVSCALLSHKPNKGCSGSPDFC